MELPIEIFNWLLSTRVLADSDIKETQDTKVILGKDATLQFENGMKMQTLLKLIDLPKVTLSG